MIASSARSQLPDRRATLPPDNSYRTIIAFYFAIHAVWSLWSCTYHEFKEILRKISLNEYFKAISHYFPVYSLSGLTADRCTSLSSSLLLALDFKSPFRLQWSFDGKSSQARISSNLYMLNGTFLCLTFSSSCLRNWSRFTDRKHCLTDDK